MESKLSLSFTQLLTCIADRQRLQFAGPFVSVAFSLSLWLIGTVRAEAETVISRAWVQSPDPAK